MKQRICALVACLLALCLLAGCMSDGSGYAQQEPISENVVKYQDMRYTRPDLALMDEALANVQEAAENGDLDLTVRRINYFYDLYDGFYTNYSLADIRYSGDLTDTYWEEEYNFCVDNAATVDNALDSLYRALAQSPLRQALEGEDYFGSGFFESYEDEGWDAEFLALLEQEAALQGRYYDLSSGALDYEYASEEYYDHCAPEMAQLLVELIQVRQEIAAYWGYADYVQFATDFYHYRDYTLAQTRAYLEEIQQELVLLYRKVNASGVWEDSVRPATEAGAYAYIRRMAQAMGGMVEEAFSVLDAGGLYDISYSPNKYNSSFEVYLTSYWVPFIFMNPEGSTYDYLTLTHEFGHFCMDYAAYGSYAGVDVLEVFSQGMEYLSLCYGEDTENLTRLKMADSLFLYVEQAAFASFEMEMYALKGEDLTVQKLMELYDQTALSYGFDSIGYDPREFVTINHYYTNPMYIISYAVSNDAAMQLYQLERENPGAGLACFQENLATGESYFLAFLDSAGLESPFAHGRIQEVRKTFEAVFE